MGRDRPPPRMIGALGAIFLCAAALSAAAQERSYELNIPRQPVTSALQALARQTDTQVIFGPEQVRAAVTHPAVGSFTVAAALRTLLEGTGLHFTVSEQGAIIVTSPPSGASGAVHAIGADKSRMGREQ